MAKDLIERLKTVRGNIGMIATDSVVSRDEKTVTDAIAFITSAQGERERLRNAVIKEVLERLVGYGFVASEKVGGRLAIELVRDMIKSQPAAGECEHFFVGVSDGDSRACSKCKSPEKPAEVPLVEETLVEEFDRVMKGYEAHEGVPKYRMRMIMGALDRRLSASK